jgi:outer membrane protein
MKLKLIPLLLAALPAAFISTAAQADETIVSFGGLMVNVDNTTSGLKGAGVPPGADLEVGDARTVYFGMERRVGPNWGFQLAGGIPPRHETKAAGSIAYLGKVSTVDALAPTVYANYHFMEGSNFRPYLGLGINYTKFINAKSDYDQEIELSDSMGLAMQAGVSYQITPEIGAFMSYSKIDMKSNLVAIESTVQTTTINFRPTLITAGLTYKF